MRQFVATLMLAGLCAPVAWAGGIGACENPFLFREAQANLVFIQYGTDLPRDSDETLRERLNHLGIQIAWLSKLTSWSMPTYGNLGIVSLVNERGVECDQQRIAEELIHFPGRDNQVLIMQHGRFALADTEETILLQSYVSATRVRREGVAYPIPEGIPFALGGKTVNVRLRQSARLTAARTLNVEDIRGLAELFGPSGFVYAAPDLESQRESLNLLDQENLENRAYAVLGRVDEEWLAVSLANTNREKFLYISRDAVNLVTQLLPEVLFVNASLGLMRQIQNPEIYGDSQENVDNIIKTYTELGQHEPSVAYLHALQGIAAFRAGLIDDSVTHLESASSLAPGSVEFQQLRAAAMTHASETDRREKLAGLYPLVLDIFAASPSNDTTLAMMAAISEFAGRSRENADLLSLDRADVRKLSALGFAETQVQTYETGAEVYEALAEKFGESEDGCFTIDGELHCTNF